MKNAYLYSALITAVSISLAQADGAPPDSDSEKCYGVAKAGENDCHATNRNGEKQSCPAWTEVDNDPYGWSWVPKGKCLQMGGSYHPPALPPQKVQPSE